MPRRNNKLLRYVLKNDMFRQKSSKSRTESTSLTVFVFSLLINFAYIIGTDSKFGVDLSERADAVHQREVTVQAKRGRYTTVQEFLLQKIQRPIQSMQSLTQNMCQN